MSSFDTSKYWLAPINIPSRLSFNPLDFGLYSPTLPPYENNEKSGVVPRDIPHRHERDSSILFTEVDKEFIVWWEEPADQDPENPMNWPATKKWLNIGTLAFIGFIIPLVSSLIAPGVDLIQKEFHSTSTTFATFVLSIFVLGFAVGPLLFAPLSEIYGRVIIYNVSNVLFLAFTMMCALSQNQAMLLAARFFSGFTGVASLTIGSGTIADIMPREVRGKAVSIWSVGTILGPAFGPVIGGYVAQAYGWRWIFWTLSIILGFITIATFLILRETYPPVLIERKAARLRQETGDSRYISKLATDIRRRQLLRTSIFRPVKLLLFYPIVTIMCLYYAALYGILYLLFSTYSFLYTEIYGFTTSGNGLVFIAGGLGTLIGLAYVGRLSDRDVKKRVLAGSPNTPEDRLSFIITIPGALSFPLGLFLYGWSAEKHVHWIVPQIGTAITGFGSIVIFITIQTYLIDSFEDFAASVFGANAIIRGTSGAFLPLVGLGMYHKLGWGWGNSVLAFVALLFAPLPLVLRRYGGHIRGLSPTWVKL